MSQHTETPSSNSPIPLRIGTRGSALALWQAEYLKAALQTAGHSADLHIIETKGDRVQDRSFAAMSGSGFFTAELERALEAGEVDVAVHSHKDLPSEQPEGLAVSAVSGRADPADWLLLRPEAEDRTQQMELIKGARVGTSSARRKSLLLAVRPDLEILDLRGNVPTRIGKLVDGQYDAIVVAGAALERLRPAISGLLARRLHPADFVPAPAQGVLAFQTRRGDYSAIKALESVHDPNTALAIRAERKLLANLRGGCQMPFGAYCEERDGLFHFSIALAQDGKPFPRRLWLQHYDADVLVVEAWRKLHDELPGRVFLSRDTSPEGTFSRAMRDHGIAVQAETLLEFEHIDTPIPDDLDALFFSSRTAVARFAEGQKSPLGLPVGAIGQGTAMDLRRLGIEPIHVLDPHDLATSAAKLAQAWKGLRVGFPQAENGLRSVQTALGDAIHAVDWSLYRTTPRAEFNVPQPDLAVMTSPLSARTYLARYPERKTDAFIAIGESTASALREEGAFRVFVARRPHELALAEAVFSA